MKSSCLFLLLTLFGLLSAQSAFAQWETFNVPGDEDVKDIYPVGNSWVALGESGCYRSADDGLTWTLTLELSDSYDNVLTVAGNVVYLLSFNDGLFQSNDEGNSWVKLSSQNAGLYQYPYNLAVTDQYIVFSSYYGVYRYDKNVPGVPQTSINFGQVYAQNYVILQSQGNDLWITYKDSLMHSADEGLTWSLVHEEYRALDFCLHQDTMMIATKNGVFRSVDNGLNWTQVQSINLSSAKLYWNDEWVLRYYGSPNYICRHSSDGGNTWSAYSVGHLKALSSKAARHNNTLIGVSGVGFIRSLDGGTSWEINNGGLRSDYTGFYVTNLRTAGPHLEYNFHFFEESDGYWFKPSFLYDVYNYYGNSAVVMQGNNFFAIAGAKIYRSLGDLRHWELVSTLPTGFTYQLRSTGDKLLRIDYDNAGGVGIILQSTDNGTSWTPTGGISKSLESLLAFKGYLFEWRQEYGLFRSSDLGATWQSVGAGLGQMGEFDAPVITFGGDALVISDYYKIAVSTNEGLTFNQVNKNLTNGLGYSIGGATIATDGTLLLAVTAENNVVVSPLFSDQWTNITGGLPSNVDLYESHLLLQSGYLYLNTYYSSSVYRLPIAALNLAQFEGTVWKDENNNGQKDAGEPPFAGAILRAGSASFTTSDTDGHYQLFAVLDNDTLRVKKPAPWVTAYPEFYEVTNSSTGRDFGLYFPPDITDLSVDLTAQTAFRPGFATSIALQCKNRGTTDADAQIRLVIHAPLEFQSAYPAPQSQSGDTLIWEVQNLAPNDGLGIEIDAYTPASVPIQSVITAWTAAYPQKTDADPANNESLLYETVVGSYDPNDKYCDHPNGITPERIQSGEALTYIIRFQNTGTYPAEFVRITDTLDAGHLDLSTFTMLSSSHPCQTSMRGNGALEFYFNPIDLPPSGFNEPESHGFVKFSIQAKKSVGLGAVIRNKAFIYFDYNAPIITNTVETGVKTSVGTKDPQFYNASNLQVFPNPGGRWVRLKTGRNTSGALRIFDLPGRLLLEIPQCADGQPLDLGALPEGQYWMEWRADSGEREIGRWIKATR